MPNNIKKGAPTGSCHACVTEGVNKNNNTHKRNNGNEPIVTITEKAPPSGELSAKLTEGVKQV